MMRDVRTRARDHCEYCRLPQWSQEATFHIDHILPLVHGGGTTLDNLALACVTCSLKKGARTSARDHRTLKWVPFFHPRRDIRDDHFRWTRQWRVAGLTPTGRATITALAFNRRSLVMMRILRVSPGRFPERSYLTCPIGYSELIVGKL